MKTFKQFVKEDNTSGGGGVFGGGDSFDHGGSVGNKDFYAQGTAVIPEFLGLYKRTGKVKSNKKSKKKK